VAADPDALLGSADAGVLGVDPCTMRVVERSDAVDGGGVAIGPVLAAIDQLAARAGCP
jgi:hypothetical protein